MKEHNPAITDERWKIQTQIEQRLTDITKYEMRMYPPPPKKLIDIVATVATNVRLLKTDEDVLKRAREIDSWNDPISCIYHDYHQSLIDIYEGRFGKKSSFPFSQNFKMKNINQLKTRIQRAELKIKVAQAFFPNSLTPAEAFGSRYEENAVVLLDRVTKPDRTPVFIHNKRPVITARINEEYL